MRLLVSVASAAEASAALAGGADVIDAKDPQAGALGAVSVDVLRDIHAAVAGAQPLSAALGDATDEAVIERDAHAFIAAGALFVKVGFGVCASAERIATLTTAAVHGARAASGGVIAACYADMASLADSGPMALVEMAARAGAVRRAARHREQVRARLALPRGTLAARRVGREGTRCQTDRRTRRKVDGRRSRVRTRRRRGHRRCARRRVRRGTHRPRNGGQSASATRSSDAPVAPPR